MCEIPPGDLSYGTHYQGRYISSPLPSHCALWKLLSVINIVKKRFKKSYAKRRDAMTFMRILGNREIQTL